MKFRQGTVQLSFKRKQHFKHKDVVPLAIAYDLYASLQELNIFETTKLVYHENECGLRERAADLV